ncbi:relaxase/mobilization nuclease domain-containing protein [Flavonifractor plautii]|nr:relaxase/mobilization nuclease domain-containing protein [Flavonifractor plautii]
MDPDGREYLSGINCGAEVAQQSFMATKNLYSKASGTFFYHYVQSFSPQENVTPAQAHQIALELAERFFPGCEVLVATHVDAEHPHSHFVVNSVHPDTGKKLHFTPRTLEQMRAVSDQLCLEHGLSTLKPYQQNRRTKGLRTGEYRAAVRERAGSSSSSPPWRRSWSVLKQPGGVHPGNGAAGLPGALGGRPEVYHLHHPHRDEVPG